MAKTAWQKLKGTSDTLPFDMEETYKHDRKDKVAKTASA
jgi:hypothetical protein